MNISVNICNRWEFLITLLAEKDSEAESSNKHLIKHDLVVD